MLPLDSHYLCGKSVKCRFIEFFVFDYDSLPNILSVGVTFPLVALDKIREMRSSFSLQMDCHILTAAINPFASIGR